MTRVRRGSRPTGVPIARRRLALPPDLLGRRALLLLLVYLLAFGAVVTRLTQIQVVHADDWAGRGVDQRSRTTTLAAQRGRLYDREGDVLATSVDAATVYADPRVFRPGETPGGLVTPAAMTPRQVADALAPVIGRDAATLQAQLEKDAHFVYLARQLDWEVGQEVLALGLPGIAVLPEPQRVYPAGELAGQVVGFTDIDGKGLSGLELQYDQLLRGRPGQLVLERAPGGLTIASGARELLPATPGTDLVLTIDREIQHTAERVAAETVEAHGAVGASVIVMEVGSGDILAMASAPGFDPNDVAGSGADHRRNRTVTDQFEPGSVQKAITAAAAIEDGVVSPDSRFLVSDRLRVGPKVFSDSHDHPTEEMTFAEIIETSSNVGTIMVAQELGAERLSHYLGAFGYGERQGLSFPGEAAGSLMHVDDWWVTSLPTIAIGQGVAVTLLQAASAYATIANDGLTVPARLLRGTVGEDGRLTPVRAGDQRRVISQETARAVREMLANVVSGEDGTGGRAAVPGYSVGGKTGTARKPSTGARGYSGEYVASFVGFAPVDQPRLVVAVMVDEPRPIYGGVVAAPAFREIMTFALTHRRVPPTHPGDASATDEGGPASAPSD